MGAITETPREFPLCVFRPYVESVDQTLLRPGDVIVRGRLVGSTRFVSRHTLVEEAQGGAWLGHVNYNDAQYRPLMSARLVTDIERPPCPTEWQEVCNPPVMWPPDSAAPCGGRLVLAFAEYGFVPLPPNHRRSEAFAWRPKGTQIAVAHCGRIPERVLRARLSGEEVIANHKAGRIVHAFPSVDEAVRRMTAHPGHAVVPIPKVDRT